VSSKRQTRSKKKEEVVENELIDSGKDVEVEEEVGEEEYNVEKILDVKVEKVIRILI